MFGWPLYEDILKCVGQGRLIVCVPMEGTPTLAVCPCDLTALGVMGASFLKSPARERFYAAAVEDAHRVLVAKGYTPCV